MRRRDRRVVDYRRERRGVSGDDKIKVKMKIEITGCKKFIWRHICIISIYIYIYIYAYISSLCAYM